ncbi:uncharacterized protein LOC120000731 [Tripterygium wilfordii]|uniref:uncharacterized protein LOC120000731 n=1 Tax=Tripterygium wilfordii TaxID=458696 RepID=UPI0018F84BAD|nr:uncharacterized protein LOC120000731 [Tripterygium wilfordii]
MGRAGLRFRKGRPVLGTAWANGDVGPVRAGRVPKEGLNGKKDELKNNGTRCPEDTIPIRRSTVADGIEKQQCYSYRKPQAHNYAIEHALVVYTAHEQILGAEATINVWKPSVETENEFSLAQISIKYGEHQDINIIKVGWHVLPSLYGDTKTRLYSYWTGDVSGETGCYNNICAGFLKARREEIWGGALDHSISGGQQFHITVNIAKGLGGHWWLKIGGNMVGSWTRDLFTHMKNSASRVEWGGKVSNTRPENRHTRTWMGAGHFAEEKFGKASYFHNLQVEDVNNQLMPVPLSSLLEKMTDENCYNIMPFAATSGHGTSFYYGGPGYSLQCP